MKFTKKAFEEEGWLPEDSEEFMKDEILWDIEHGEYECLDEVIQEWSEYVEEFSPEELMKMDEAIDDRQYELEEERIRRGYEDEEILAGWLLELDYMNREYYRSVL